MEAWLGLPYIVGVMLTGILTLFPWATLAAAAALAWAAARRRGWDRVALAGVALYFAAAGLVGVEHRRWQAWHYTGNGLKRGMTVDEVDRALAKRSNAVRANFRGRDAYLIFPTGPALVAESLKFPLSPEYYVEATFGPDGRLAAFQSGSEE